jgi:hypothetical protein
VHELACAWRDETRPRAAYREINMIAICPTDPRHGEFATTAHVAESWKVNREGDWIETLSMIETTHAPSADNHWTCIACGSTAVVFRAGEGQKYLDDAIAAFDAQAKLELKAGTLLEGGVRSRPTGLAET